MYSFSQENGQTEFIDFVTIGGGMEIPFDDNSFRLFLTSDYSIGALFHKIDMAALVNVRTNLSDIMAGGQLDYYGFNLFGFGLGGGMVITEEKELTAYIRGSTFFHVISTMKMAVEFEYRTDSRMNIGITISIPFISCILPYRSNNVHYSHLTTDKNIIGKWKQGDEKDGIFIEFKLDQTFEIARYLKGEIIEKRYGYFSTGELGKLFEFKGIRLVYTDKKKNEGVGSEYILENNNLIIDINGEKINMEKTE
jgi:hypothetical protein